ncbi:MAG: 4Fe-4S dicluster domain-containing protein [Desulfobacteraceae bacterium]|nr:4Fe-4S dicluster domain-containing protein [Desulfobacteraceae bacterium]
MKAKTINKKDIASFLDDLIKEYEVFAPIKRDVLVLFDTIGSGNEALLNYKNSKISPKGILFPQSETLFRYSSNKETVDFEVPSVEEKPRVIFGIRPCDARGLTLLDQVFDGECKDPYYVNRRANTVVVSIGCTKPQATCFCTSVGGGPFSNEGSDLLLIDIGDDYVVQIVSDKGEKLLEEKGLEDASEDKLSLVKVVIQAAEESIGPRVETDGLKEKLDNRFEDPIWQELTEKCLGCGVCTYLCPTCHCFDIVDEAVDFTGERIRTWDSCQFPLFTLQASGLNPRPTVKERFRQRIMHKFSYMVDDYGQIGCVGCGRCVTECPVNLDIRQVLDNISKLEGVK